MLQRHPAIPSTIRLSLVISITLCLLLTWGAQGQSLKFAWLSDTHIGSGMADEDLRISVRDINGQKGLDFVILSGDVTEYGSWEQLRRAREILNGLAIPFHVLPGNHDTKWSESGGTDFPKVFGSDRFMFEQGGIRFLGLHQGPLMKMGDGHWAPQDVAWLEEQLGGIPPGQPVIFVTHYPIDAGIANWWVVSDRLKRVNIQAALCGHGHANQKLLFEGIPGVMGRSNLRTRQHLQGYNVVEISGDRMTFSERIPGVATKAPWHTVKLARHDFAKETVEYPRPDFTINQRHPEVGPAWTFDTGNTIASSPAIAGNLAIVGDASGSIRALDIRSGREAWKIRTGGPIVSTPAVSRGLVVFASTDGTIRALKAASGQEVWCVPTLRPVVASPAIEKGVVYIGSSDGIFRALDLKTGTSRWEFPGVRGFVETRPLIFKNRVIFGAWGQRLYALETKTGELAWTWRGDKGGDLFSPAACWPVGAHDKVFVAAPDRMLTAIDIHSGKQVWRTAEPAVRETIGLSTDSSRIYVRDMNNFFRSYSTTAKTPVKVWETDAGFGYDINSAMMIEKQGVVFYGTKNDVLYALESTTGRILWAHKFGTGIMNTVLPLSRSEVLVTDFDGKIGLIRAAKRK
ncbi:MAG: PQQ-binding-like beta-propeller repeat protein [Verrucomicrobia bacterium]|nr:PQQ-binding-like beta-propeller repeat protein [Verrucomicrobiota bacterium]